MGGGQLTPKQGSQAALTPLQDAPGQLGLCLAARAVHRQSDLQNRYRSSVPATPASVPGEERDTLGEYPSPRAGPSGASRSARPPRTLRRGLRRAARRTGRVAHPRPSSSWRAGPIGHTLHNGGTVGRALPSRHTARPSCYSALSVAALGATGAVRLARGLPDRPALAALDRAPLAPLVMPATMARTCCALYWCAVYPSSSNAAIWSRTH